jgi:hypothetical protein
MIQIMGRARHHLIKVDADVGAENIANYFMTLRPAFVGTLCPQNEI